MNNDPVNFTDPFGLSASDKKSSIEFFAYTMGDEYGSIVKNTRINYTDSERGFSAPWGSVYIPKNDSYQGGYNTPREYKLGVPSETGRIGLETHELYHQVQYKTDITSLPRLAVEQIQYSTGGDPYAKGDPKLPSVLKNVQKLSDIPTLEGQAQFVGQWNADVYQHVTGGTVGQDRLQKEAQIILNSGIKSQAAFDILSGK